MTLRVLVLAFIFQMAIGLKGVSSDIDLDLVKILTSDFTADESMTWEEAKEFKNRFNIRNDLLHQALMEIKQNAVEKRDNPAIGSRDEIDGRRMLIGVMRWLPLCNNSQSKSWLLDIASTLDENELLRTFSIFSYLRIADAQEAKQILVRFLIGREQMYVMERYSLYQDAQMAWHSSDSMEKKAAIVTALYMALSEEPLPWVFSEGDAILQGMSPRYANSRERLALLERARAYPFPERRERTRRELTERFEKMRKLKTLTSGHANFVELMLHDFSQPSQESERYLLEMQDASITMVSPQSASSPISRIKVWALGGGIASLLGVGVLLLKRCRK